jgi:aspartyl aminopeptidase
MADADDAPATDPAKPDELVPKRKSGWQLLDADARKATAEYADAYATYLAGAKTPRRAVRGLVELARGAGATALADERPATANGSKLYFVAPGGDAAAFVRVGERPIEEGVRIVIASVDAPHFDLKQQPVFSAAGFGMLDTAPYGDVELESWLVRPLALYLYAARPGAKTGPVELVLGEAAGDPVLVIPDLLPHLSGGVQSDKIVDSPERMNALAASSRKNLLEYLAGQGIDEQTFQDAEVALVPAGAPRFIGVDRALLAGYGHTHRALAFAAVRALLEADRVHHTAMVIIVSRAEAGNTGDSGTAFVSTAMSRAMAALAADVELDVLGSRRIYSRSAAIVAGFVDATRNRGIALNPRSDDALPGALRRVMTAFGAGGAQWHLSKAKLEWGAVSRELATLDLDVVEVGLPLAGVGAPYELVSTLDLYQGYLACRGWLASD